MRVRESIEELRDAAAEFYETHQPTPPDPAIVGPDGGQRVCPLCGGSRLCSHFCTALFNRGQTWPAGSYTTLAAPLREELENIATRVRNLYPPEVRYADGDMYQALPDEAEQVLNKVELQGYDTLPVHRADVIQVYSNMNQLLKRPRQYMQTVRAQLKKLEEDTVTRRRNQRNAIFRDFSSLAWWIRQKERQSFGNHLFHLQHLLKGARDSGITLEELFQTARAYVWEQEDEERERQERERQEHDQDSQSNGQSRQRSARRSRRTEQLLDDLRLFNLDPDASHSQIQQRYRELAKLHHPDLGGDHRRMAEINAAYDRLMTI